MKETAAIFRSVLPHEPLSPNEKNGFVHIQGAFLPKDVSSTSHSSESIDNRFDLIKAALSTEAAIKEILFSALSVNEDYLPLISPLKGLSSLCEFSPIEIEVTVEQVKKNEDTKKDMIPCTKARIMYSTPYIARDVACFLRHHKIAPSDLFFPQRSNIKIMYSVKNIQATQVTQIPLPPTHISWPRTGMPKFRRLLIHEHMYNDAQAIEKIELDRKQTRFVFMTNIINYDPTGGDHNNDKTEFDPIDSLDMSMDLIKKLRSDPHLFQDAIRTAIEPIIEKVNASLDMLESNDSKWLTLPPEVFVPAKKQIAPFKYCHIGTRSPLHAQALIRELQNRQITINVNDTNIKTGKLYLDFADVTQRSAAKSNRMQKQDPSLQPTLFGKDIDLAGESSKPECTSTTEDVVVPGLICIHEFVSEDEENVLIACLTGPNAPWAPEQKNFSKTGAVKRRVQHYGYVFDYESADVLRNRKDEEEKTLCPPMPYLPAESWTKEYLDNAVKEGNGWDILAAVVEGTRRTEFDVDNEASPGKKRYPDINQMTVNVYKPGQGIGSHIDTESAFCDGLISISLGSNCVMEFKHKDTGVKKLVHLPPRSLLLMSGDARYIWNHQIVTRMTDCVNGKVLPRKTRVSLTLRTAITLPSGEGKNDTMPLPKVETCVFPPKWGKVSESEELEDEDISTPETEREHVHAVYDAIATQWHHTRGKRGVLWPGATKFLKELPKGSIVADVGCGDGKYFPAIWEAGSYVIGTDISEPLLQTSIGACANADTNKAGPQNRQVTSSKMGLNARPAVAVGDCMYIPLQSKSCDAAICIAVMHHLSTSARRIRCLKELSRVVKKGGLINVQAWALEQESDSKRKFAATDVFVPFNAQPRYLNKVNANGEKKKDDPQNGDEKCKGVAEMYSDAYEGAEYDERKGLVVFQRYCHMYKEGELEDLVSKIDSLEMVGSGFESGNHFVILRVI